MLEVDLTFDTLSKFLSRGGGAAWEVSVAEDGMYFAVRGQVTESLSGQIAGSERLNQC